MENIRNKKEFIYKLGDKLYTLGGCACEECLSSEVIAAFRHFEDLTDFEEFQQDIHNMSRYYVHAVGKVCRSIEVACRCEYKILNDEELALINHLEQKYGDEIDAQIQRWLKASRCGDIYEIDEKERKKGLKRKVEIEYLIVGSGLYGTTIARELTDAGHSVLVIDKRPHIAGNVYTESIEGINVHIYGAHIFHTNNKAIWDYIQRFAIFNRFTNSPVANYKGELYSLPFNMYTFNKMWGVVTPEQAVAKIEEQKKAAGIVSPANLEEQAISLVGKDIYEKLIKGYTQKQWGRPCNQLPAFIIKRLPVRLTFDNNYFNALYQGIPVGGYTKMVEKMLAGIKVKLNTDYFDDREYWNSISEKIIYTGPIDTYFNYVLGNLEYRSVRFEKEILDKSNFQGNAVVNYTDAETQWTRIIEHKWFEFGKDEEGNELQKTIISREYSSEWKPGDEPYYPVNDEKNSSLYLEYKKMADAEQNVMFGGRLGEYKYYDMDQVIASALQKAKELLTLSK